MTWVADHRKHHAHTDQEGDPHSPHGHGGTGSGRGQGPLVRAHGLAVRPRRARPSRARYARDLYEDRGHAPHRPLVPALWVARHRDPVRRSATLIDGTLAGALAAAAVGRPGADLPAAPRHLVDQLRLPLLRHAGASTSTTTRRTCSGSRLLSMGESWHHNHHAFPRSARHGLRWWEVDPTGYVIRALQRDEARLERGRDHARAPGAEAAVARPRVRRRLTPGGVTPGGRGSPARRRRRPPAPR